MIFLKGRYSFLIACFIQTMEIIPPDNVIAWFISNLDYCGLLYRYRRLRQPRSSSLWYKMVHRIGSQIAFRMPSSFEPRDACVKLHK